MVRKKPKPRNNNQKVLGEALRKLREKALVTRKELGRRVKVTEQQIARYEDGDLIPIVLLERMAEELGAPIQKKFIRQIMLLRHQIAQTDDGDNELAALYAALFNEEIGI